MQGNYTSTDEAAITGYWSGLHSAWIMFQDVMRKEQSLEQVRDKLGEVEKSFRDLANQEVVTETVASTAQLLSGVDPLALLRQKIEEDAGPEALAEFDAMIAENDNDTEGEIKLG